MTAIQPDYFTGCSSVKMTRYVRGVLVVEFRTKGEPLTFTARDHTDFVDAFYRIGQGPSLGTVARGRAHSYRHATTDCEMTGGVGCLCWAF
jgi:hypothetical protein